MFARRKFLQLASAAPVASLLPARAFALDYPTRPIRIVIGFPPGGSADIIARLIAQRLSDRLGKPVIIDNRPGAGSSIGAGDVVKAPPDGYTLLWVSVANAINATLYDNLSFDILRDIAPVAGILSLPNVMEVNPAVPAKNVAELISYAKANANVVKIATTTGTTIQLTAELFRMRAGVSALEVPYRGAPEALMAVLAGETQVVFDVIPSSLDHIRAGKVRALAVTTATRSPALPDVPSLGEFVPGYEASTWYGIGAPRETPDDLIVLLNHEINALLAEPDLLARLTSLGGVTLPGSAAAFGAFIGDEVGKWAKVIKFSGAKAG